MPNNAALNKGNKIADVNATYSNGANKASIKLTAPTLHMSLKGSTLRSITADFNTNALSFNITVVNQTSLPQYIKSAKSSTFTVLSPLTNPPVYQYIQINETGGGNVDSYVNNVTYNFSVPVSWLADNHVSPGSVKFLKYSSGLWTSVQTTYLGGNSTYDRFSALSDSLSSYAVSYTSENVSLGELAGVTTANLLLNMPIGFQTYLWTAVPEINVQNQNFTLLAEPTSGYSINGGGQGGKANATYIGYSTAATGNVFSGVDPSATGLTALTFEGVGANVIYGNGNVVVDQIDAIKSSPQTLSYTVPNSNSFVILSLGMNDAGNSAGATPTAAWPAGCTPIQNITGTYGRLASSVICPSQASGSQSVSVTFSSTQGDGIGLVAYIFPQYALTLDDANPTTGHITTDGFTALPTGSVVNVIGYGEITANAPSGYILNNWALSNSINATIDNPTQTTTNITVMGNDILTANYVAATVHTSFVESGLPTGATWYVNYRGIYEQATTLSTSNTIPFLTNPGNFAYSIDPSITYSGNTYTANLITGNLIAGNTIDIKYAATPKMSMQFNPTFSGVNDNITANSVPNTDGIEILADGVSEKTGSSGTITWNALGLAHGTYTINALDTTSGGVLSETLVVGSDPSSITNAIPITLSFPNITVSSSEVLSSDQFAWNFKINSGVTLTTNGFSIMAINNFTNSGTILTGNTPNGGAGSPDAAGNPGSGSASSFAGSGAGGGGNDGRTTLNGGNGGSTIAAGGAGGGFDIAGGAGATPSAPAISGSNVVTWYNSGVQSFFEGAGGGGGGGTKSKGTSYSGGNGGGGAFGLFIEAKNITAGTIIANGVVGGAGDATGKTGGGGGGGGGAVLLVYRDKLSDGGVIFSGGAGGAAGGASDPGGQGGNGQLLTYQYISTPPIPVIPSPFQQLIGFNSLKYQSIEEANMLNTEFFYANSTIIPSWLEANDVNNTVNSLFWVNLKHGFRGNGTITIYMGMAAHTTNLQNLVTGQAPELNKTYGLYDSGANVFVVYANGTMNGILTTSPDASIGQVTQTLTSGLSGPVLGISTTASTNAIAWGGSLIRLTRYIINGFIQATQSTAMTGLGGEMETVPQGYIFGAGTAAGDTAVSIANAVTSSITTLASTGTGTQNSWVYLQSTYNDGVMSANEGTSVLSSAQSVAASDSTLTGNYAGIAVSDTSTGANLAYYQYFYVHTYPMGGSMPYVSFGARMGIPPPPAGACGISLSNSVINFGSINPSSSVNTANLVVDTNQGGTSSANILVDGTNMVSGSNNFYISNTLWNPTSLSSYAGNALKLEPGGLTDTKIAITGGGAQNIFFGIGVPAAQPSGSYTQNIVLENQC